MARIGNVGGTARWSAKMYHACMRLTPDISEKEMHKMLIRARYQALPDPRSEEFILRLIADVRGLKGLVVLILSAEAGFRDNSYDTQRMFYEVIHEELSKKGVPERYIVGLDVPVELLELTRAVQQKPKHEREKLEKEVKEIMASIKRPPF